MNETRSRRRSRIVAILLIVLVLAAAGTGIYRYNRPLPALNVSLSLPAVAAAPVSLPFTASGESAITTSDNKVLGQGSGANEAVPTASIAKIITILTVLKKYPLTAGESGPTITLTQKDVDRYNYYIAIDGSTAMVSAGEQITEYQMLQAMLLPSANNMADSLAIWAYGSLASYKSAAQAVVNQLGMSHTTIGSDASGFLPDTTSTALDLTLLGQAALKQPVIMEIAAQPSAVIPVAATIYSTNPDLGVSGITGLKTGTSDQAGNCFLFTATHTFDDGQVKSFVGVVMNSPTESSRFSDAASLLKATYAGYADVVVAKAGQSVGTITSDWGAKTTITPADDVSQFIWSGDSTSSAPSVSVAGKASLTSGESVGTIADGPNKATLETTGALAAPSILWRIFH